MECVYLFCSARDAAGFEKGSLFQRAGGAAHIFAKHFVKILHRAESAFEGDFNHVAAPLSKHFLGSVKTDIVHIVYNRAAGSLLETAAKLIFVAARS